MSIQSNLKPITSGNQPTTDNLALGELSFGKVNGRYEIYGNTEGSIQNYSITDTLPSVAGYANIPLYNVEGLRYLVGSAPSGAFTGANWGDYAEYRDGQWNYFTPINGQETFDISTGGLLKWNRAEIPSGNAWQTITYMTVPIIKDMTLLQSEWEDLGGIFQLTYTIPGLSSAMSAIITIAMESYSNVPDGGLFVETDSNSMIFRTFKQATGNIDITALITPTKGGL